MGKFIESYCKFESRWWFLFFPLYYAMLNVGVIFYYHPTHVVVKILCVVFLLFCTARVIVLFLKYKMLLFVLYNCCACFKLDSISDLNSMAYQL